MAKPYEPSDQRSEFDLRRISQALRRRAWLIVAITVGVALLIYLASGLRPDLYEAAAEVRVIPSTSESVFNGDSSVATDREIANQLYLFESPSMRRKVADALGQDSTSVSGITVQRIEDTDIARIRVVSRSPELAANAANTYAEIYVQERQAELVGVLEDQAEKLISTADSLNNQINELDERLAGDLSPAEADVLRTQRADLVEQQSDFRTKATEFQVDADLRAGSVAVITEAHVPSSPFSPRPVQDALLAAVLTAMLACAVVVAVDWLDDRIKTPPQVEAATGGLPVIGSIPMHQKLGRGWRREPATTERTLAKRNSPTAEAYRTLQTSLRFSSLGKAKRRIAITSASSSEGKTTITANLAIVLAEGGVRVVVVSADLRRPRIGALFDVDESTRGLTSVLLGDADLADCLIPISGPGGQTFALLPTGPLPHNPAALLATPEFDALLKRIEMAKVDLVLLDCAPVLPVSDTLALSQNVDGVLMVALADRTHENDLAEAADRLHQVEADVLGIVLNAVPQKAGYRYGYYGYGNYYGYGGSARVNGRPAPARWFGKLRRLAASSALGKRVARARRRAGEKVETAP